MTMDHGHLDPFRLNTLRTLLFSASVLGCSRVTHTSHWINRCLVTRLVTVSFWLVVEPTPLKNMSSSVGMMKFPIYEKWSKPTSYFNATMSWGHFPIMKWIQCFHIVSVKIIDCGGWSLFQMVGGCMVRPLSHHQPTVNSPHQASDPPGAEVTNAPGPSADRWSLGLSSDFLAVLFLGVEMAWPLGWKWEIAPSYGHRSRMFQNNWIEGHSFSDYHCHKEACTSRKKGPEFARCLVDG